MSEFEFDVRAGLGAPQKHLSSKYFYDDRGSEIFQEIMKMPSYYLTNAEFEILSMQGSKILDMLDFEGEFSIIELGAGDGIKTKQLLRSFLKVDACFEYAPIDISAGALDTLEENLKRDIPTLDINPYVADYFEQLAKLSQEPKPMLILFLGSNIGNYPSDDAVQLLSAIQQRIRVGDKILIGFDLKKNPLTIQQAYLDPDGITKSFNLNLLRRINRELGANFLIDQFDFYCHYNPETGEVNSYIVSLKEQVVHLKRLNESFAFKQNELIWTELSKKYDFEEIKSLARATQFEVIHHFLDCKHYFSDCLMKRA